MNWVCKSCTTFYAVDAPACPHCGGTEHWDSFEYEELMMGKITNHGGLTDQATGAGFSGDPDDERAAGTRVPENSDDPAQVDGLPTDEDGNKLTADGEQELTVDRDGTGEEMPDADIDPDEEKTSEPGRYADWSKADLIGEAERRDPPVSTAGTKAEIIERLLTDDIRREQEPGA